MKRSSAVALLLLVSGCGHVLAPDDSMRARDVAAAPEVVGVPRPPSSSAPATSSLPACKTGFARGDGGACAAEGVWIVSIRRVEAGPFRPGGVDRWDPYADVEGLPDLSGCAWLPDKDPVCSPIRANAATADLAFEVGQASAVSLLRSGVRVSIADDDGATFDMVCPPYLSPVTEADLERGTLALECGEAPAQLMVLAFRPAE